MTTEDLNDAGAPADAEDSLAALWRALKTQASRFERRMAADGKNDDGETVPDAATAEKDARTLSVLVRAYESLSDLSGQGGTRNDTEADGSGPDIEALRRELAEGLGRLCEDGRDWPDAGAADDGPS